MANNKDFKVKNGIKPTVYHEGVGTVTSGTITTYFTLESAVYDSIDSAALSSQIGQGQGIFFKPDGTKVYVSDQSNAYQYSLSTAWNLSTLAYDSKSLSLASASDPNNTFFKPDGTKFYVVSKNDNYILEYDVSTAWDISTAPSTYSRRYLVSAQMTNPTGIFFKPDGTKMYVLSNGSDTIYQYSLSTAWNVTTASYDSKSFSVTTEAPNPRSLQLNDDGTKLFVVGWSNDTVYQYSLTTAYDISTAAYSGYSLNVSAQSGFPYSMSIKEDGSKLYVLGAVTDKIHQYSITGAIYTRTLDISTGSVFEITPTSDIQIGLSNPAASGTVSSATLLLNQSGIGSYDVANAVYSGKSASVSQDTFPYDVDFNNDGTKMYMFGSTNDTVYEYDLSTAYDVSTATYNSSSFSLSAQDSVGRSIVFKPDGTKLYYVGANADNVYQYSLSTAWDISTASYDSVSFYVGTQDGIPNGITFNNDGTKFYITGLTNDTVYQYSMSTAYNMSTASYDSVSFSVTSQAPNPYGIQFNSDGTKMYILDANNDSIYQYSLSTAFNVSTASYDSVSFSVATQEATPYGFTFADSGTKIYVVGGTADTVFQYSAKSPATITYDTALEWAGGTAPTSPAIGETDVITISTRDGGTTYQAIQAIDGAK